MNYEKYKINYSDILHNDDYDFKFPKHKMGETTIIFFGDMGPENNDIDAYDIGELTLNYLIRNYEGITVILYGGDFIYNMDYSHMLDRDKDEWKVVAGDKPGLYINKERVEVEGQLANVEMQRMSPFTKMIPFMVVFFC
jgi:hypothetical protein